MSDKPQTFEAAIEKSLDQSEREGFPVSRSVIRETLYARPQGPMMRIIRCLWESNEDLRKRVAELEQRERERQETANDGK